MTYKLGRHGASVWLAWTLASLSIHSNTPKLADQNAVTNIVCHSQMLCSMSLEPYREATEPSGDKEVEMVIKSLYCSLQGKYQAVKDEQTLDMMT